MREKEELEKFAGKLLAPGIPGQNSSVKGYSAKKLFTYSTEHLAKKDKVRFYYGLKGRDGHSGIVQSCQINHLGRTVLLSPPEFADEVREFLKYWKCKFTEHKILWEAEK